MNPLKEPLNRIGFILWSAIAYAPVLLLAFIIRENSPNAYHAEAVIVVYLLTVLMILVFVRRLQDWGMNPWLAILPIIVILFAPFPAPEGYVFIPAWLILLLLPSNGLKKMIRS